ncbi:hypothetical protein DICSQDRAFT_132891 [Dichomitus squalens LYAD-421 SS1]|uniref:uncharacterized protein n=1 Tax=Dichomitus squalens (strain LYAD-421) TaxID=732165 RepID=UPI00044150BC|nr:uncharacterized protein DICSQDRAFT_132891 [Dichomitus squalens LYAD-421 SS1]EJF65308.1 hypothetical protein DICSQDRAFT_132891 [Dichomitus squalens LYAD-421 SS1]
MYMQLPARSSHFERWGSMYEAARHAGPVGLAGTSGTLTRTTLGTRMHNIPTLRPWKSPSQPQMRLLENPLMVQCVLGGLRASIGEGTASGKVLDVTQLSVVRRERT